MLRSNLRHTNVLSLMASLKIRSFRNITQTLRRNKLKIAVKVDQA